MNWKKMNFDWNRARAFLVAAEAGSLSAAARALKSTQPTIGRQVAALEAEMGVTLFERVGQGLVLTECGLELLEHVRAMGEAANSFSLRATGQSKQLEGSVCISVSESEAVYRLPEVITRLRQEEPGIQIEVIVSNEVSDLKRREADIALRCFRPTEGDLITRKLLEESIWFYGTPEYIQSLDQPKKFEDIQDIKLIGFNQEPQFIDHLKGLGLKVEQKDAHILTTMQTLQIQLARRSLGLGVFSEIIEKRETELVRAFPHLGPIFTLPLWIVCHRELQTNPRVRRVFDMIVAVMTKQ